MSSSGECSNDLGMLEERVRRNTRDVQKAMTVLENREERLDAIIASLTRIW